MKQRETKIVLNSQKPNKKNSKSLQRQKVSYVQNPNHIVNKNLSQHRRQKTEIYL